jgi:hypothetical protein
MRLRSRIGTAAVVAVLAACALAWGIALHPLAVDDAHITYRFAHNLSTGQGFAYNPGRPVLSTTSPLYALVLAAAARLGPDIPALANALSALCLGMAALLVFLLGRREGAPASAALAALLLISSPLLWLSLGLETALFLALSLAAIVTYRRGRLYATAVLLALATLTRGDGLILAGVLGADYLLRRLLGRPAPASSAWQGPWRALGAAGLYLALMAPLLVWLTWQFGSPLPATLAAKRAQARLGVTGFYAHTTYLEGAWILLRARFAQSPLYLLFVPALLAGLASLKRAPWAGLVAAWGMAHLAGYTLLGVTPYYWYYAPLVPAAACLSAVGVERSARWVRAWLGAASRHSAPHGPGSRRGGVTWVARVAGLLSLVLVAVWALSLVASLLVSDAAAVRALKGPVPPPEDPTSKVLPEAKVDVYRQAGDWLRDHTAAGALVGVTEVGVLGYYAERPMVDFLGLLEVDVAQALARGDLYWALVSYQPDYLALTAISPLYAYDLRADPWFQAAYVPVQTFEDARFWGSPLTVYRRQAPRVPMSTADATGLPAEMVRLDADLGQIRLLGAVAAEGEVGPGSILPLTLYWQALEPVPRDYTVFVHLLGQHDRVIAQRDASPGLGARPTSQWVPGQVVADPYLLALPEGAYTPDQAVWEVGLYDAHTGQRLWTADGSDNVRFGSLSVGASSTPLHLDFGPVALTGYNLDRLALRPGEVLHVALHWAGEGTAEVRVQLRTEAGEAAAAAEGSMRQDRVALALGAGAPPGAYDLEVQVFDPATGQVLPLLGADGQPQSDRARLTKVRVYP